ncbi:nucleotide pyrophosphohydrolase [bacterium]|nr:nucleotide pyrophosphohydrolase [bacterium]
MATLLLRRLRKFRRDRDWEQFHTPRNLATALGSEIGELLEIFRWKMDSNLTDEEREKIKMEIADINIFLNYLCDSLCIDLEQITHIKMDKNETRYTIEKAKGNSQKISE